MQKLKETVIMITHFLSLLLALIMLICPINGMSEAGQKALIVIIPLLTELVGFGLFSLLLKKFGTQIWKIRHKNFYIHGKWHTVHYNIKAHYLRYGEVEITQKVDEVIMKGVNTASYAYDTEKQRFVEQGLSQITTWNGHYNLDAHNGMLTGIFTACRAANDNQSDKGTHEFVLSIDRDKEPTEFSGIFTNKLLTDTPTTGSIKFFQNEQEAQVFLNSLIVNKQN